MKYTKGSFAVVPLLSVQGLEPALQVLYSWLCFYANQDGASFPSIKTLSKKTGLSESSIFRKLKELETLKLITKQRRKRGDGSDTSNIYSVNIELLGENEEETVTQTYPPVTVTYQGVTVTTPPVSLTPLEHTHITKPFNIKKIIVSKDTIIKESEEIPSETLEEEKAIAQNTPPSSATPPQMSDSIRSLLEVFYKSVNPLINFGHRGMRTAAEEIITKLGSEQAIAIAQYAVSIQGKEFAPTIGDPIQLKNKLASLFAYKQKKDGEQNNVLIL